MNIIPTAAKAIAEIRRTLVMESLLPTILIKLPPTIPIRSMRIDEPHQKETINRIVPPILERVRLYVRAAISGTQGLSPVITPKKRGDLLVLIHACPF
jgi:hypothetical protein